MVVAVPTSKTVDINQLEGAAACLELINESKEKAPSLDQSLVCPGQNSKDASSDKIAEGKIEENAISDGKEEKSEIQNNIKRENSPRSSSKSIEANEQAPSSPEKKKVLKTKKVRDKAESGQPEAAKKDEVVANEAKSVEVEAKNEKPASDVAAKSEDGKEDVEKPVRKLKEKSQSLDSEPTNETPEMPARPMERRRSKIFETAEKFNQLAAGAENDKPKKIFIPGVNVGGAKRAFERKASLSSITIPQTVKPSASKIIIEVPAVVKDDKVQEKISENFESNNKTDKQSKLDEEKKRAVDIITGAIGKPPVMKKMNGSPPTSPQNSSSNKLGLKLQVGPNDLRNATVSVSSPVETKFAFESKPVLVAETVRYF